MRKDYSHYQSPEEMMYDFYHSKNETRRDTQITSPDTSTEINKATEHLQNTVEINYSIAEGSHAKALETLDYLAELTTTDATAEKMADFKRSADFAYHEHNALQHLVLLEVITLPWGSPEFAYKKLPKESKELFHEFSKKLHPKWITEDLDMVQDTLLAFIANSEPLPKELDSFFKKYYKVFLSLPKNHHKIEPKSTFLMRVSSFINKHLSE